MSELIGVLPAMEDRAGEQRGLVYRLKHVIVRGENGVGHSVRTVKALGPEPVRRPSYRVLATGTVGFSGEPEQVTDNSEKTEVDQNLAAGAEVDVLLDGYSLYSWNQGSVGPGLWVAEARVRKPEETTEHTVFSSPGGLQVRS